MPQPECCDVADAMARRTVAPAQPLTTQTAREAMISVMANPLSPSELTDRYEQARLTITAQELFRKPGMSRLRELWIAARFGTAFERHIAPCAIAIEEVDAQDDVDFELHVGGRVHQFQVAEVMTPGRRRSDEYKRLVPGTMKLESWDQGTCFGIDWIRDAIQKKIDKHYSTQRDLHLLLYVNFPAQTFQYEQVRDRCIDLASQFAGVWLITGEHLACIHLAEGNDPAQGWMDALPPAPEGAFDEDAAALARSASSI
jgi:hypothetical protein